MGNNGKKPILCGSCEMKSVVVFNWQVCRIEKSGFKRICVLELILELILDMYEKYDYSLDKSGVKLV